MNTSNNNINGTAVEKMDFQKEIRKYLRFWPWFLFCSLICISLAYVYLSYTTPVYSAKSSIIIKDESGGGAEAATFAELGLSGAGSSKIDEELGIMLSRRIMIEVVKALDLHIQFFKEGKFRTEELYDEIPFSMQVLRLDEQELKEKGSAEYEITKDRSKFRVTDLKNLKVYFVSPGEPLDLGFVNLVFSENSTSGPKNLSESIIVKFKNIEKVASKYQGKIAFSRPSKSSGLIELVLNDPVRQKARDILDQLILEYNRDGIEGQKLIAGNTAKFINERLSIINGELDSVETGKETFKEENRLTDIQAQSQMYMQNANEYNKRRQEVNTQLELSNSMLNYITTNTSSDLLPANLGISEDGVNRQINEYNKLVLERNSILSSASEKNPMVVSLNRQIDQIKGNVVQSLKTMRSNLLIGRDDLNRQSSSIGAQIFAIPAKEREYRGIERQQDIKETLYLFLLQKREENSLALALTEPKAKIVDRAFSSGGVVSPNPRSIYLGALFMGMFVPFSIIYIKETFDNKVRKRADVESLSKEIGVVGLVPKVKLKASIIQKNDRSVLAESFRILVTNLQYLLVNSKKKSQGIVLFVTSTIKGEGKTFTSINVALTLSNSSKRVLLVGADLRNPKLQPYIEGHSNGHGISDYLISEEESVLNLISPSKLHTNLDILLSGTIPPNPYELLKQEKVATMFEELEGLYDYIIVDTAPSMPVADTFLLTKFADLVLYVIRAGYTEKEMLSFPLMAKSEGKFENVSFLLNDVKPGNIGYGKRYGYGYAVSEKETRRKLKPVLKPTV